jgi:quinoprotein glucose dehydrogenase
MNFADFRSIVVMGGAKMPPLERIDETSIRDIYSYLGGASALGVAPLANANALPSGPVIASGGAPAASASGGNARVGQTSYPPGVDTPSTRFVTDYGLGHPYIMMPPWSTLTAYDLDHARIKWRVPIGQDSLAAVAGGKGTGVPRGTQRNGMVVTSTGIVFSTAKDGHVYAFSAENGGVLWSAKLPMGTEGLPSMFESGGQEYLVVNATTPITWGAKSRESGIGSTAPRGVGGYVVFGLP